jgi:hypothetical protein
VSDVTREEIEVLAYAVERLTVEVQELASAAWGVIGLTQRNAILEAMGDVNRRLLEVFPELGPPERPA